MTQRRYQLGTYLPLSVFTESKTTPRTAGTQDAAPTYSVYDSSGTSVVTNQPLPQHGLGESGLYGMDLFLGSAYAAGDYCVLYKWNEGGVANKRIMPFTVIAGAASDSGVVTSLYYYDRPHADFLIAGMEDGTLEYRRNPYLS